MNVAGCRPQAALLVLVGLAGCKKSPPPPPPPPEVEVQPVEVRDTPVQVEFTGEIKGGEDAPPVRIQIVEVRCPASVPPPGETQPEQAAETPQADQPPRRPAGGLQFPPSPSSTAS